MRVTVLYHGILADITGTQEETYSGIFATDELMKNFQEKYPQTRKYIFRIAVNNRIISGNSQLREGDTVDLIPPFPGG